MSYRWDCTLLFTHRVYKEIQFNDSDQCDTAQYAVGESGSGYQSKLGFGAGMAPAYAAFIIERKYNRATVKSFIKKVFQTPNAGRSILVLILFALVQFCACILQEEYSGNPWYMFILFMPMMILGGGLEEIGWQGVFQPCYRRDFPFLLRL